MKGWRDHLRFLPIDRYDPVAMVFVTAAAILLFFAVELAKGVFHSRLLHRIWHEASPLPSAPAGIDSADYSADGTELSGWAPPSAMVRVLERGQEIAEDQADDTGAWDASFTDDTHHELRLLTVFWRASDKMADTIGQVSLFAPGPSADDAYLWWQDSQGGAPRLLQSPDPGEKGNLFLTLAQWRGDGAPLLEGQAAPHSLVQAYADNQLAGAATADEDGRWSLSPLIGNKKSTVLRFDELDKSSVHERRTYKFAWPENKDNGNADQPALLQTTNDGWLVGQPVGDGRALFTLYKLEAGVPMPPGKAIPGQVIPVEAQK